MGEVASPHAPFSDWLESEIELAAGRMSRELGEDSVCTIHRDGRVTGGLKYQEGRLTALAGLRRGLREAPDAGSVIDESETRWRIEFERRRNASPPSPIWVSYATGGLDATREARVLLHRGADDGGSQSQIPADN